MAKKDGEHPEFDDMNFSDDELSGLNEGGSDALNFSEIDPSSSGLGSSGLFDFSETDSPEASSLDLAGFDEDESAPVETLDFEEPSVDAAAEPKETPLDDKNAKGKKAKVKKEKKPKEVKVKEKKEKKVKEKTPKEKKIRAPKSPSDRPGFLIEAKKASPFTVMLFLSASALGIAVLLLLIELLRYGFAVSGS